MRAISKFHKFGKGAGSTPQRADCGGNCKILNDDGFIALGRDDIAYEPDAKKFMQKA